MSVVGDSDPQHEAAAADKALVDQVIADMRANFERWEDLVAAQDAVTFEADLGDIYAVVDHNGRLRELALAPDVMSSYTYIELQARLNAVIEALRKEVTDDFERNFGGGLVE